MKHYCHYHPISPAKWYCKACHCYFDNACVPSSDEKKRIAACPHCSESMDYCKEKLVDTPYWQNIVCFIKRPFQVELLLILLLLTLASVFLSLYPSLLLFGTVLTILMVTQISMSILENISKEPKKQIRLGNIFNTKHLASNGCVSLVLLIAGGVTVGLAKLLGVGWAVFSVCFFTLLLPTWILAFSTSKDMKQSLMPENLLRPILEMGKAYLGVTVYVAGAILAILLIADFLDQHAPDHYFAPTIFGVSIYFSFCLSAMLGYILAEYDGFKVAQLQFKPEKDELKTGDITLHFDANLDIHLKQGRYREAINLLEAELKRSPDSEFRRNQFLKLCLAVNDMERIERYVHAVMQMLLSRNQLSLAKNVLLRLRDADEKFHLHDLQLSLALAKAFQKRKEDEMVMWLAKDAHSRFGKEYELAELFMIAAKTLVSKMKDASQAAFYLRYIIQNFPDDAVSASAKILQAHIEKYATTA